MLAPNTPRPELVVVQHLVPSVVPFARTLLEAFPGWRLTICGKYYSTIPAVQREVEHLIADGGSVFADVTEISSSDAPSSAMVLDEGGRLYERLEGSTLLTAGVEQTSSGNRLSWRCPTVLVCRSAAKLLFESQIIARGIIRKLQSLGLIDGRPIGVIGVGALGRELALRLIDSGCEVTVHDILPARGQLANHQRSLGELIQNASLILGVTGRDCLSGLEFDDLAGDKVFASCSSSNREFGALARRLDGAPQFDAIHGKIGMSNIVILNGGYPINFDREREWELPEEISLTRRLCFEGLQQAERMIGGHPRGVMLDPATQLNVVEDWLHAVPERHELRLPARLDVEYFRVRSEGEHEMSSKPDYTLHSTTPGALAQMRAHDAPYETEVVGLAITVLPGVWSPQYDWSSAFYVENFPDVTGLRFLEIGSGTGVISVFAGLRGASKVVATDVNPEAVHNTKLNFELHDLSNAEAILSEGFDRIAERFDVITWNAPYHGSHPNDLLERGCADEDYRGIRAFFDGVQNHLNPGGVVVFGFSESGDLPLIRSLIAGAGLRVKRELSDWRQEYNCMLFELVPASQGCS